MISERSVARHFGSLWRNVFPMLTPSFMRIFNASYVRKMASDPTFRNMNIGPVQKRFDSRTLSLSSQCSLPTKPISRDRGLKP